MTPPVLPRTSDAYVSCIVLQPGRAPTISNVLAGRLMSVEDARREYAAGRMVWVAPGDVEAVQGG